VGGLEHIKLRNTVFCGYMRLYKIEKDSFLWLYEVNAVLAAI